ncbi:MAG: DUF2953 domain-containing protein [Lachnospiraceae bacterium]|nr:DUF2953 domain-containing protein [Lachnospiraceae bacterium]
MDVVLLILKIIGILLLVVIGLILLLLVLVVFCPVTYRINAAYETEINAKVKVGWLFYLITVTLSYQKEKQKCVLRILGIPIIDFLRPKPKKNKQSEKPKKAKPAKKTDTKPALSKDIKSTEKKNMDQTINENEVDQKVFDQEDQGEQEEKLKLTERLKKLFEQLKQTILTLIQKVKDIYQKGLDLKKKADAWITVLGREQTKNGISKAKGQIISLLLHILPRKWKAYVKLGFDDPSLTGKIMGYYWMFIGLWGEHLICVPDFENRVLEASLTAKGHIRGIKFIYVAWKVLFDKDLKYLRKLNAEVNDILNGGTT